MYTVGTECFLFVCDEYTMGRKYRLYTSVIVIRRSDGRTLGNDIISNTL